MQSFLRSFRFFSIVFAVTAVCFSAQARSSKSESPLAVEAPVTPQTIADAMVAELNCHPYIHVTERITEISSTDSSIGTAPLVLTAEAWMSRDKHALDLSKQGQNFTTLQVRVVHNDVQEIQQFENGSMAKSSQDLSVTDRGIVNSTHEWACKCGNVLQSWLGTQERPSYRSKAMANLILTSRLVPTFDEEGNIAPVIVDGTPCYVLERVQTVPQVSGETYQRTDRSYVGVETRLYERWEMIEVTIPASSGSMPKITSLRKDYDIEILQEEPPILASLYSNRSMEIQNPH